MGSVGWVYPELYKKVFDFVYCIVCVYEWHCARSLTIGCPQMDDTEFFTASGGKREREISIDAYTFIRKCEKSDAKKGNNSTSVRNSKPINLNFEN